MRQEKLLITGSGLLGSNIVPVAAKDFEVFATYRHHTKQIPRCRLMPLDIRNRQQVDSLLAEIKPALVIHTAALVNVDYCQEHAEEAWVTNTEGTENVAIAAREAGAKLVYISTDSVFDGKKGMYNEQDEPNPVNVYARTKLEGEERVSCHLADSIIVRTAFYGWNPIVNKNLSLAEWVVRNLREGKPLPLFTDVFFSPVFVINLAEVLLEMYQHDLAGVFHVGGSERCSKYAFGRDIAEAFGLDRKLIEPISIEQAKLKAPRPKDVSLNVSKASGAINTTLLDVREGIARFRDRETATREE